MAKLHWNQKIEARAVENVTKVNNQQIESPSIDKEAIMKLTTNLPNEVVGKIEANLDNKTKLHIVLAGSSSSPEENGWPSLLKEEIETAYSPDLIKVSIVEFPEKTSTQIINEELYQQIIDLKPDVLLLEPIILYDNGRVRLEDRLANLTYMLDEFRSANPNLTVLLQPANPLYNAKYYPPEVGKLKEYAEVNEMIYLDHWVNWPDQKSEEMKEFVQDLLPTEKGHEVWADFLIKFFIAEEH